MCPPRKCANRMGTGGAHEGEAMTPWTATLTYVPGPDQIPEGVCAENPREYYNNKDSDIPKAEKPDF